MDIVLVKLTSDQKPVQHVNPHYCYTGTNPAQTAKTLPEQKHKGGRLFFYEEWHRVQRTKSIFLFYFCMLNRDIFSLVSCFKSLFLSGRLEVVLDFFFSLTEAYTYACCHVVIFFFSFSSILLKFFSHLHFLYMNFKSLSLFIFLSCSSSFLNSRCIISLSDDKNFSDTEFTVYSCTDNFIMLLSYV